MVKIFDWMPLLIPTPVLGYNDREKKPFRDFFLEEECHQHRLRFQLGQELKEIETK